MSQKVNRSPKVPVCSFLKDLSRYMFFLLILSFALMAAMPAWASLKEIKVYKEAYPDEKPKCACCHVSDKPKKEDGQHDLNEYGKKVIALNQQPTAENYTAAGKAPEPQE